MGTVHHANAELAAIMHENLGLRFETSEYITLLHYLSIKPERASCGTKWQDCFAALASIYHIDSIVTDL